MRLLFATALLLLPLLSCVSTAERSFAERYYNIATDYYKDKNYKQAVAYYELALQEDPNLKVASLNYGLALIEVGDYQQAEQQLMLACAVDRRNALCLSALGYLNFWAEKYEAAASWYRQVILINPYNPETFYNLGIVEHYIGDYKASQQAFDKVSELQAPKERPKELRRFAALNQLHFGEEEKAMELYSEYFSGGGSDEQVFQEVYDFYSETEQYDQLRKTFRLFEKSLSSKPLAAFLLAELYYLKLNRPVLGLKNLQAAVNRNFGDEKRLEALVKKLKGRNRQAAQKVVQEGPIKDEDSTKDPKKDPTKDNGEGVPAESPKKDGSAKDDNS